MSSATLIVGSNWRVLGSPFDSPSFRLRRIAGSLMAGHFDSPTFRLRPIAGSLMAGHFDSHTFRLRRIAGSLMASHLDSPPFRLRRTSQLWCLSQLGDDQSAGRRVCVAGGPGRRGSGQSAIVSLAVWVQGTCSRHSHVSGRSISMAAILRPVAAAPASPHHHARVPRVPDRFIAVPR